MVLVLFACVGLFIGVLYYFAQQKAYPLLTKYLAETANKQGLQFKCNSTQFVLLPVPGLVITEPSFAGPVFQFSAQKLTISPDFRSLLKGELQLGALNLLRPELLVHSAKSFVSPEELALELNSLLREALTRAGSNSEAQAAFPHNIGLELSKGKFVFTSRDGARLDMSGLQCAIKLDKSNELSGQIAVRSLMLVAPPLCGPKVQAAYEAKPYFKLSRVNAYGNIDLAKPLAGRIALTLLGELEAREIVRNTHFQLRLEDKGQDLRVQGKLAGDLGIAANERIPISLDTDALWKRSSQEIDFQSLSFSLGADSGKLSAGQLLLPNVQRPFALTGKLDLRRASLSQWLGFARNLSPGLQLALDNIFDASLEFRLDGKGLEVGKISAYSTGAHFEGSGSVPDWLKPEIRLDLHAKFVNLGQAIPEAVARLPEAPYFSHPPLTPVPGEPSVPGEIGIDYDIRLGADRVSYEPLILENALVRIYPGKIDANGFEDCQLSAEARFYGGELKGSCILGGTKELPYTIDVDVRDVDGAPVAKAMPVLPLESGKYSGQIHLNSQGRELELFLQKLRGNLSLRSSSGALRISGEKLPFANLKTSLKLRSGTWYNHRLGLDGQWLLSLGSSGLFADVNLDGRIWFGPGKGSGVNFEKLPGSVNLRFASASAQAQNPITAKLSGNYSCLDDPEELRVGNAVLDCAGILAKGELVAKAGKYGSAWQGRFKAECPDLSRTILLLSGEKFVFPPGLRKLSLGGDFNIKSGELILKNVQATAGKNSLGGALSLNKRNAQRPLLEFEMSGDSFDMQNLLGPEESKALPKKEQMQAKGVKAKNWDFAFLRKFDAKGQLKIKNFLGWRVQMQNLYMPIALDDALLKIGPSSARFYGAPLHSRAMLNFRQGLAFDASFAVNDFDLGAAMRERSPGGKLTGRANLEAEIRAKVPGPGRLPAALNGSWSFLARDGSYQSQNDKGEAKGKPTLFAQASASGTLLNGILQSNNFKLRGPDLSLDGGGTLNLNNQALDCNFNVNMKGFPEFPLRVSGTLEKSKSSIGAGKLILNTIGGITRGFVDILGGVVEGVWKIFR